MKALLPMKARTNTSLGFSERAERIFAFVIPILSGLILLALERNTLVRARAKFAVKVMLPIFLVWALLAGLAALLAPIPFINLLGDIFRWVGDLVGWGFWIVWLVMLLGALFLEWHGRPRKFTF